jgi:hypothetical protein
LLIIFCPPTHNPDGELDIVTPVVVISLLLKTTNVGLVVAENCTYPGDTILIWMLSAADAPSYTI